MDRITRRRFVGRTGAYALGGVAGSLLTGFIPKHAQAQQTRAATGPRQDWLAQTVEPALEPDLPIIDPHHHLWDRPGNR